MIEVVKVPLRVPAQRAVACASEPGAAREVVEVRTETLPAVTAGQTLVRVVAAAVNHSEGLALRGGPYAQGLRFPADLGYEGAGVVIAPDPAGAHDVGARVCWAISPGSCADYAIIPTSLLVDVPDEVRLADAARVVTAGVAAHMLTDVLPVAGKWALVWGAAGPVGRQLTALLVEAGATVVGVASGAERVAAVHGLGAQHVVDRTEDADVAAATTELCSARGIDIVFDPVGAGAYRTNLTVLARHGCLVSYGELSGSLPAVDLTDLMDKAIFVTKFGGGGPDFGLDDLRAYTTAALDRVARDPTLVAPGPVFPLAEVAAAYDRLAGSGHGKALVSAYDGPEWEREGVVIARA